MSETMIVFPFSKDKVFDDLCQDYAATMRDALRNILGIHDISIVKLSFLNYNEKYVYEEFPVNTKLYIHNTSLLSKFGFGRYVGAFFDVIIRVPSGNLVNMRMFYAPETAPETAPEAVPEAVPKAAPQASPQAAPEAVPKASPQAAPEAVPKAAPECPSTSAAPPPTMNILGQERVVIKRGRTTYVNIDGKEYTLTEARKLENKKR